MLRIISKSLQYGVTAFAVTSLLFFGVGPHFFNYRTLTMLSGSMAPNFPTGSELIDTSIPTSQLRVGDVLTYRIPAFDHHVESHRVVSIKAQPDGAWLIRTKGDHNNALDPWTAAISSRRVWIARVDLPDVGSALRALRSPLTLHLLQWVIPGILLLWLLRGVWTADNTVTEAEIKDAVEGSQEAAVVARPAGAVLETAADSVLEAQPVPEPERDAGHAARPVQPSYPRPVFARPARRGARRWLAPAVLLVCVPIGLWSTRTAHRAHGARI